ncbi:MAG TPA: hypothetical protein VND93_31885 [Myxococcales bacterium]|nr:hypothetical protein [Myxococcales bacterium]
MPVNRRCFALAAALALTSCVAGRPRGTGEPAWDAEAFRHLESLSGDLEAHVQGLDHPSSGYAVPTAEKAASFRSLLSSVFTTLDGTVASPASGDWCAVRNVAAPAAGYSVRRFHDTCAAGCSNRWFFYAWDSAGSSEAILIINPYAKRNVVIEVPHARTFTGSNAEDYTAREGVRLLKALAARALLINGATRCASADPSGCTGTTGQCSTASPPVNEPMRASDCGHSTTTFFFLAHQALEDRYHPRFVQLHGKASPLAQAIIGDGTTLDTSEAAVSVTYANALSGELAARGQPNTRVDACQAAGDPEVSLCGEVNVEGRYTNAPAGSSCTRGTTSSSGRFLHVEQQRTLGTNLWQAVSGAVAATWPECDLNNGSADCTLGAPQVQSPDSPCL